MNRTKVKYLLWLLICIIVTSCIGSRRMSEHQKILRKITNAYIDKSIKEEGFRLSSFGGGMIGDIQRIHLGFDLLAELDIDKARVLVVRKEEEFLDILNGNREVRPYLHVYPFPAERFEFEIGFENTSGRLFAESPNLAFVFVGSGKVHYSIYNKEKSELETIYTEPYEEAYKIVYGENAPSIGK
jgi:hypothetical protein